MSSVLDALRKVEDEKRAARYGALERLLSLSVRPRRRSRARARAVIASLLAVGFVGGAAAVALLGRTAGVLAPSGGPAGASPESELVAAPVQTASPATEAGPARGLPAPQAGAGGPVAAVAVKKPPEAQVQEASEAGPESSASRPAVAAAPAQSETGGGQAPQPAVAATQPAVAATTPAPVLSETAVGPSETALGARALPDVVLALLQWSAEPEKRLAFIRVDGGPMLMVQEGDTVSGLSVERILEDAVEFRAGGATLRVRARD